MTTSLVTQPPDAASGAALMQVLTGYWISQATYVAAKLGIPDLLAAGPQTVDDLAARTSTNGEALGRLLRALADVGVVARDDGSAYALTPMGALLRSDVPGSMRSLALTYNEEQYRAWGDLLHSVRSGGIAFDHAYGMPIFDYFETHPASNEIFNDAMTSWSNAVGDAVASAFDFSRFDTIVDVGGGHGALLAAVLRTHPAARGVLYELPRVVATAGAPLDAAGVSSHCELVGGDFFVGPLPRGDAYVLSQILHDWDESRCLTILDQCRRVMSAESSLLIVELVVPETDEPSLAKWLDLHMLVMTGGKERTLTEYDTLLHKVDMRIVDATPIPTGQCVIEASLA